MFSVDILARDTEHSIYFVEGAKHVRYALLTAVNMKITGTVLWDPTPCALVEMYQ
jgi:hypothetical protein